MRDFVPAAIAIAIMLVVAGFAGGVAVAYALHGSGISADAMVTGIATAIGAAAGAAVTVLGVFFVEDRKRKKDSHGVAQTLLTLISHIHAMADMYAEDLSRITEAEFDSSGWRITLSGFAKENCADCEWHAKNTSTIIPGIAIPMHDFLTSLRVLSHASGRKLSHEEVVDLLNHIDRVAEELEQACRTRA